MSTIDGRSSHSQRKPVMLVYHRGGRARTVRLDPRVALAVGIALVVLGTWYLVATIYLVFRDDLLSSLVARHTQVQYAYEDRIAALRTSIDRLTSRQLIDQDGVDGKVQELMTRQAQLETRQAMVAALASHAEGLPRHLGAAAGSPAPATVARPGALPPALGGPAPAPDLPPGVSAFAPPVKPHPAPEFGPLRGSGAPAASPLRPAPSAAEQGAVKPGDGTPPPVARDRLGFRDAPATPVAARLARLEALQAAAEARQLAVLDAYAHRFRGTAVRLQGILADVGLEPSRFALAPPADAAVTAQGGPFVPVKVDAGAGPFEASVERLQRSLLETDRLQRIVEALPLRRPLPGDSETTSHFGVRADPFTRAMAMHTGVDFRDDYGSPVRVTAPGTVVTAEWSGGYGNMVEVDHGSGLSTRYAHLSQILVAEGQTVPAGGVIGRLGSTGRSTGPHLHYETRVDGEPVDPMRYLRAAQRLLQP